MAREICPLCGKRISDWMHTNGKIVVILDKFFHSACVADNDIKTLQKGLKEKT